MSLRENLSLELEDGTEIKVSYDGRDLRAWEGKYHKSALVERLSVSTLTWLGHHAAARQGLLPGNLTDWAAFEAVCVSFARLPDDEAGGPVDEEEGDAGDPTQPTPGVGSSAPSPSAPASP